MYVLKTMYVREKNNGTNGKMMVVQKLSKDYYLLVIKITCLRLKEGFEEIWEMSLKI